MVYWHAPAVDEFLCQKWEYLISISPRANIMPSADCVLSVCLQDLGSPSEKIWPGYNELPAVKKMTFTEYPYNNLRKRFGALLSDQGFDLMNK